MIFTDIVRIRMTLRLRIFMPDGRDAIYILTITACRNPIALIGYFSLSISEETHEIVIYATRRGVRADNLTICYRKKQFDVSF